MQTSTVEVGENEGFSADGEWIYKKSRNFKAKEGIRSSILNPNIL